MKKKILVALMAIIMSVSIAGCGNMSMGFGNFEFKKIHVDPMLMAGAAVWSLYSIILAITEKENNK